MCCKKFGKQPGIATQKMREERFVASSLENTLVMLHTRKDKADK